MKNKPLEITDWKVAEEVMLRLAQHAALVKEQRAKLDDAVATAHAIFEADTAELRASVLETEAALRKFAGKHKKEFKPREAGGDTRSFEHANVVMGFRTTPPQVRIENEEAAVDWLAQWAGGAYVRTKVEPDRQALADILKDDSDPAVEKLAAHGITLQQRDKFFCEVKEQK